MLGIVDFGSQYTHLIASKLRKSNVRSEIISPEADITELIKYSGLILSGGPHSVNDLDSRPKFNQDIIRFPRPIAGFCYGFQLLVKVFGGEVNSDSGKSEYGPSKIRLYAKDCEMFDDIPENIDVWMSHTDSVIKIPYKFSVIGQSETKATAGMYDPERNIIGLQFHPEVSHTQFGTKMLENFARKICKITEIWSVKQRLPILTEKIKKTVGNSRKVFMLVSGGVDSTVAYTLLNHVLGPDRVHGIYIDTGFMRQNETSEVLVSLSKLGYDNLEYIDASDDFFKSLADITCPRKKRKIIGNLFIDTIEKFIEKFDQTESWILGQGTIYPDTIESGGTKHAATIKTHHNRVPKVLEMLSKGDIVEPIVDFYKDEVRELGKLIGLPGHIVNRHPFPGPGLALRVLCTPIQPNRDLPDQQAIRVDTPGYEVKMLFCRSVGVQGDQRTYSSPAMIVGPRNYSNINILSTKILNENIGVVNRGLYFLGGNHKELMPIANATLTKQRVELIRKADHLVTQQLQKYAIYDKIWQMPVVLVPIGNNGNETVVLRPVSSVNAMTASWVEIDWVVLDKITELLLEIDGIQTVLLDVTNKPPGTIEWE